MKTRLRVKFYDQNRFIYLYKNSTYRTTFEIIHFFRKKVTLSKKKHLFNKIMSKIRIAIKQKFDFTQKQ